MRIWMGRRGSLAVGWGRPVVDVGDVGGVDGRGTEWSGMEWIGWIVMDPPTFIQSEITVRVEHQHQHERQSGLA